jgi:hypothetical protein
MTNGLVREPGESLVRFYNRRLVHNGRDDVVWTTTEGGRLKLVERDKRQSRMDFEGAEDARC